MRARSLVVFCVVACAAALRTDQKFWQDLAQNELHEALQVKWNFNTAKNVILFVGDGMDPNTVTATRIYKGGESHRLVYEKFPHVGLLKTYSADKMAPDSASSATALFCGVKANQDTMGVDATVKRKDCEASLRAQSHLQCLAAIALQAGKSAGLVTTMRVTHATPGPMYAHCPDRKWECEDFMPPQASACKDIARQLVEDWPGRDLNPPSSTPGGSDARWLHTPHRRQHSAFGADTWGSRPTYPEQASRASLVIMGGGRDVLVSNKKVSGDGVERSQWSCARKDGRDLIAQYKADKIKRGLKYSVVGNNRELMDLNVNQTDYLLGIFSNDHMQYEEERNSGPDGSPALYEMVEKAIKVLRNNKNGYFLMVEGGNVDMAHHSGWVRRAIEESAAMELAVQVAANMTDEADTLLIVTSDHTHTLAINGYPDRGSNIFGISQESPLDGTNYTILSYTTGASESFQFYAKTEGNETKVVRRDPSFDNTTRRDYIPQAGIKLLEEAHGGGDVIIYARGPHSHLFHNVHEQHYVYHAISYAAKIGVYSHGTTISINHIQMCLAVLLSLLLKL